MKLSDVITPGDKIDIKMLHEANQEDNGGEIAKIYQSAVSDIFSDQELEISMPTSGGRMVLFQLERECSIVFYTKGGMYNCTAVVKKRYRKENLYLLRIVITSGLQKFQRREFFRDSLYDTVKILRNIGTDGTDADNGRIVYGNSKAGIY